MKRGIILSIALVATVASAMFLSYDSSAQGQQRRRFSFDTGVVTLGPHQSLRMGLYGDYNSDGDVDAADYITARLRRMEYIEQGNIYRIDAQSTPPPVSLGNGEAAIFDVTDGSSNTIRIGRGIVSGFIVGPDVRGNVRATATIINTLTGETVSHTILGYRETDFN